MTEQMPVVTKEQLQALIADCKADIERLEGTIRRCEANKIFSTIPGHKRDLLIRQIALAALTATAVGSFHILDQGVEATTDYVKPGEWPIDDGELIVYTAPPVPTMTPIYQLWSPGIAQWVECDKHRYAAHSNLPGQRRTLYLIAEEDNETTE